MKEEAKMEMISRRKALSLLGLGAALGSTLSSALEPLEAEAQEATAPAAAPPPGPTECNADKVGAPIAVSDGRAAMSDATDDERVKNQPRRSLPEQLPRNSCPRALNRLRVRFDERRMGATRPAG